MHLRHQFPGVSGASIMDLQAQLYQTQDAARLSKDTGFTGAQSCELQVVKHFDHKCQEEGLPSAVCKYHNLDALVCHMVLWMHACACINLINYNDICETWICIACNPLRSFCVGQKGHAGRLKPLEKKNVGVEERDQRDRLHLKVSASKCSKP